MVTPTCVCLHGCGPVCGGELGVGGDVAGAEAFVFAVDGGEVVGEVGEFDGDRGRAGCGDPVDEVGVGFGSAFAAFARWCSASASMTRIVSNLTISRCRSSLESSAVATRSASLGR